MLNLLDWKLYAVIKGIKNARKHKKSHAKVDDLNRLADNLNQQIEVLISQMAETANYRRSIRKARKGKGKEKVEIVVTIDNKFDQQ